MSSYNRLLVHKAEIYRRPETSDGVPEKDPFGQPLNTGRIEPTMRRVHRAKCRLSFAGFSGAQYRPGETMSERYVDLVREPRIVFLDAVDDFGNDIDVREADRIKVFHSDGETLILDDTEIESVRPRYGRGETLHHIELLVSTFRDGAKEVGK